MVRRYRLKCIMNEPEEIAQLRRHLAQAQRERDAWREPMATRTDKYMEGSFMIQALEWQPEWLVRRILGEPPNSGPYDRVPF